MSLRLERFKVLTFDCYGTLIDWETGILAALRPWAKRQGVKADDDALLGAFGRAERAAEGAGGGTLYPDVLRDAMGRIARDLGGEATDADREALATSVGDWPAFEDTRASLERLKKRCALVVVSNVDENSFARTREKLGVELDGLVTAERVGAYKPDVRMFRAAIEAAANLDAKGREHLHVAQSLHHDIEPANRLGLASCWIDRRAGRPGGASGDDGGAARPDFVFTSMAEFADAVERAHEGAA